MNFTNCSRVPASQATTQPGTLDGIHDGVIPNPSGKITPDNDGTRPKLLSCRSRVFISTINTRTLNPKGRVHELVLNAKKQLIDIIAVQEHRIFHPENDLQYQITDGYHLATLSCSKNSVNASLGGVRPLLSPRAMENVSSIEKTLSRVLIAEFEGNPKTTIRFCYAMMTLKISLTR